MAADALSCLPDRTASGPAAPGMPRLIPAARAGRAGRPAALSEHLARFGPLPFPEPPSALIAEIGKAGLTGRGGAAFPTARKLAAVRAAGGRAVVIANGTEGEPASRKDQVLLASVPHLVLDGAVAAARAVGASRVIVAAHESVAAIVAAAAAERRAAAQDAVDVDVRPAACGFVAGEATAVVNWLENGDPRPMATPPRLAERGWHGRPTLVQNVETLAHLALIARYGARWFRSAGTPAEPGSMLVTIACPAALPGVREVAIGTPLCDILSPADGDPRCVRAVLVGGYFGTWLRWTEAARLDFSAAGLAAAGAAPGAGLIAALPAGACGLLETARLAEYLAAESAGQCGPCVFGLDALARELTAVAVGVTADVSRLERWGAMVTGRGGCRHPDGAVRMIRSALRAFSDELERHAHGWCTRESDEAVLCTTGGSP